ncbi:ATP-binding protein [Methylogaea oryzae]|uniref:Histidine kinase n=1 Tax=Methylogaea oryzae TaxID=1295382 RepID=A0A8D4VS56_9GAMM|nr:ATP-binding protein [Methylogaea oryzae]BBL71554.1 histidine kinase [Methylogaea oryzae]
MSLRFRLNLMIGLTLLAIVGAGGLLALHNARRSVEEEVGSSVRLALQLVEAELQEQGAAVDSDRWLARLARLESARHLRIQVEQEGRWQRLALASPPPAERVPAWFRWAVEPPAQGVERRVEQANGLAARILIEADPGAEMGEAWREARGFIQLMTVLATAVLALVYVTLGRAFNAVNTILDGLQHMENGDYDQRLPAFSVREFSRISDAFNHAVESLGKARAQTQRSEAENRRLTRRLLQVQEDERRAVVRELHDELGQSLSAMKALAVSLRQLSPEGKPRDIAVSLVSLCDRLFPVVRGMMQRMRPLMLEELGLKAALEDLLDGWRSRCPNIRWRLECDAVADDLPEPLQINLFRIVQEALSNAVKHADPANVRVALTVSPEQVRLTVSDDGRGYDAPNTPCGMGLSGMRERVHGLDGEFRMESEPGRGARLEALLPLAAG